MLEGVIWNELSEKRCSVITKKVKKLAKTSNNTYAARKGMKVGLLFTVMKMMHQSVGRKESPLSADNQHWKDKGWIHID